MAWTPTAANHITGELDKLTVKNKYHGGDQIHTANSAGVDISHVGHTTVLTLNRDIHLKNVFKFLKPRKILFQFISLLLIILPF